MKKHTIDWSRFYKFDVNGKVFVRDLELNKTYRLGKKTKVVKSLWKELGKKGLTQYKQ